MDIQCINNICKLESLQQCIINLWVLSLPTTLLATKNICKVLKQKSCHVNNQNRFSSTFFRWATSKLD